MTVKMYPFPDMCKNFVLFILIAVTPHTKCRLKHLKLERIKDYLLMEEEFLRNQERLKPQEEKDEVRYINSV